MIRRWVAIAIFALISQSFISTSEKPIALANHAELIAHTLGTQINGPTLDVDGTLLSGVPWGLDRIDQRGRVGDNSFTYTTDGTGVKVYILDSGVNASHPALNGVVGSGWSYRSSSTLLSSYHSALLANASNPLNGIPACPATNPIHEVTPSTFDEPSSPDSSDVGRTDNDGHGTHVAGIIAGTVTGVAKNATIIPVRALDSCGNGTELMIRYALDWILADHQLGQKAIVNMSIGFDGTATNIDSRITSLINEGVLVVAAAGNGDDTGHGITSCGTTPAGTSGTFSVGASNSTDAETTWSNYGDCVDIFAPGSNITSTWPYYKASAGSIAVVNGYHRLSGTSMAAPHVTGALAQYLQTQNLTVSSGRDVSTNAWIWLKVHATCNAITYSSHPDLFRTPNRLLATADAPATGPCSPSSQVAVASSRSIAVSWDESISGNGAEVTYTVTASPGGRSCSTTTSTCTVTGLLNGTSYTFSIVAANTAGLSSPITVVASPVGPADPAVPIAPSEIFSIVSSKSITISWNPVVNDLPVTYVVTNSSGVAVCTTTATSCTVQGLVNGSEYSFSVSSQTSAGLSTTAAKVIARPGFTVLKTTVSKKSRTTLTSLVKTISNGKKTWSEWGTCSISSTRLVAPSKATKCKVTLKVAKTSKYPAMSTKVTITVK